MKIDISKYKDVEPQAQKFCEDCGSKYILKSAWVNGYDPITGEPKIILWWECSSKEKWSCWKRFWHQDTPSISSPWVSHESFSTNEKGE